MRLILGVALVGLIFTIMGFADLGKDIGGSHADFSTMQISDFKEGDIIHGTITENLGQAAYIETTEYTFVVQTDKYTSAGYYVIPFFSSLDAPVPDKILLYKTGNKKQMSDLDALEDETDRYYFGEISKTYSHITVDRAEVHSMDAEERQYFLDYIREYVEWFYQGQSDIDAIYQAYVATAVPFVVQYNAGGGGWMLTVGVTILVIMAVVFVLYLVKTRNSAPVTHYVNYVPPTNNSTVSSFDSSSPSGTTGYTSGSTPGTGTNGPMPYNSSSSVPPYLRNTGGSTGSTGNTTRPPIVPNTGSSKMDAEINKILSTPSKPRDNISITPTRSGLGGMRRGRTGLPGLKVETSHRDSDQEAFAKIISAANITPIRRNSYIGSTGSAQGGNGNFDRPMPPIEGLDDTSPQLRRNIPQQENIYGSSVPPFVPPTRPPKGDSMPSVDPHSEDNVDLSNGGINPEDRAAIYRATMPHNGDIPVVNPNRNEADAAFADSLAGEMPEMPKAPEMPTVAPVIPAASADSADFMVQPTDPSLRNQYNIGGHLMQEVDPYTETNVDVTNGGIEREPVPEESAYELPKADYTAAVYTAPEQPAPVFSEPVYTEPAAAAPEPVTEKLPDFEETSGVQDIPSVQDVSGFGDLPTVQSVSSGFTDIPTVQSVSGVQDIPSVQDIPTVQDVPKVTDFPSTPDYSASYARPEFPQAPSFPGKIETPAFPQAPKFPDSGDDDSNNNTVF